jgi:hypothetical protein
MINIYNRAGRYTVTLDGVVVCHGVSRNEAFSRARELDVV